MWKSANFDNNQTSKIIPRIRNSSEDNLTLEVKFTLKVNGQHQDVPSRNQGHIIVVTGVPEQDRLGWGPGRKDLCQASL